MSRDASPWYRDGLRFRCTQCGNCCRGGPGFVWVDEAEIARLAAKLEVGVEEFQRRFVRLIGDRMSLIERSNHDCVFWDQDAGCTVYEARPNQCRTWPFWPENLGSPNDWERVQKGCPGAGRGTWHSLVEIEDAAGRTWS